jgi:hypothetical protein
MCLGFSGRVLLLLVLVGTSFPQTRPAPHGTKSVGLGGHTDEIEPPMNRLQVAQQAKSEFETTEAYETRRSRGYDPSRQLVFRAVDSNGFHYGARFEYDGDAGAMNLSLAAGMEPGLLGMENRPITLDLKHVVRNAFGVTVPYTS